MKFECSKRVRTLLRQLAATAYERELRCHLSELEKCFVRWHKDEIDSQGVAGVLYTSDPADVRRRGKLRGTRHMQQTL